MLKTVLWLLLLITLVTAVTTSAQETVCIPDPATVLATLRKEHPRLLINDSDLARLKSLRKTDKILQKCIEDVLKTADVYCTNPTLSYKEEEGHWLPSGECTNRIFALGIAWRLTGDEKYARKAEKDLLAVCALENWTPSQSILAPKHELFKRFERKYGRPSYSFLDVSEMSLAVGIGYDWFYSYLSEQSREKIKSGLIRYGLEEGVLVYQGKGTGPDNFITYDHNWNLVCNGGLIVGALAVAETDPDVAKIIITGAVKSLPLALKSYGPDGAWPEGPAYWNYGTEHVVYGLAALESALGTDFGLSEMKGLSETGLFPIIVTGPTGLLNFELDALGVRWVRDLGRENYNLPEIWDFYYLTKKLGGKHFNYYRIGSFSHNIPVLNGINQDELAKAKFLKYESGNSLSFVTIDLTEAYAPLSGKTIRGVAVVGKRRAVLVQDEFEIEKSCDIAWGITTDADIKLDRNEALLMLKGKELTARIL